MVVSTSNATISLPTRDLNERNNIPSTAVIFFLARFCRDQAARTKTRILKALAFDGLIHIREAMSVNPFRGPPEIRREGGQNENAVPTAYTKAVESGN